MQRRGAAGECPVALVELVERGRVDSEPLAAEHAARIDREMQRATGAGEASDLAAGQLLVVKGSVAASGQAACGRRLVDEEGGPFAAALAIEWAAAETEVGHRSGGGGAEVFGVDEGSDAVEVLTHSRVPHKVPQRGGLRHQGGRGGAPQQPLAAQLGEPGEGVS